MYDLNSITPAQAQDPTMPPELMAQLAAERPDLRRHLLKNPSLYPQLRQWILDSFGGTLEPQIQYTSNMPIGPSASEMGMPSAAGTPIIDYGVQAAPSAPQPPQSEPAQATVSQYAPTAIPTTASSGEAVDWSWRETANSGPLSDLEAFANGTRSRKPRGEKSVRNRVIAGIVVAVIVAVGLVIAWRVAF